MWGTLSTAGMHLSSTGQGRHAAAPTQLRAAAALIVSQCASTSVRCAPHTTTAPFDQLVSPSHPSILTLPDGAQHQAVRQALAACMTSANLRKAFPGLLAAGVEAAQQLSSAGERGAKPGARRGLWAGASMALLARIGRRVRRGSTLNGAWAAGLLAFLVSL